MGAMAVPPQSMALHWIAWHWVFWVCCGWATLLVGFLLAIAALARALLQQGRRQRPAQADVAIVLGAYTHGYRPSPTLLRRLHAGLDLYRRGYAPFLIVSGGRGADESVAESSSMKRFFVLNGVPEAAVVEDRHSTDTWENLINSQQLMAQRGWTVAVIVTSDYHLPRALAVARQVGIVASGYAAWSGRSELRYARREVMARITYTLTGRAAI